MLAVVFPYQDKVQALTIDQHCLFLDLAVTSHIVVNLSDGEGVLCLVSLCIMAKYGVLTLLVTPVVGVLVS
jgi:hypothetical protein